jgi:hypothetical protein
MAVPSGTSVANDLGTGYIIADGFLGTPSAANKAANLLSTQPAAFPNGASLTGTINSGTESYAVLTVVATGSNSQSGSRPVVSGYTIIATVSGSTRGVRLSGGAGSLWNLFNDTAFNVNVYPATNMTIAALSTNTKTTIAARKATTFYARSATHVVTQVGA